jgi:hypothetical protein
MAEGSRCERGGGTVKNIEGEASGHTAVLQTDFERYRAAVAHSQYDHVIPRAALS